MLPSPQTTAVYLTVPHLRSYIHTHCYAIMLNYNLLFFINSIVLYRFALLKFDALGLHWGRGDRRAFQPGDRAGILVHQPRLDLDLPLEEVLLLGAIPFRGSTNGTVDDVTLYRVVPLRLLDGRGHHLRHSRDQLLEVVLRQNRHRERAGDAARGARNRGNTCVLGRRAGQEPAPLPYT